MPTIVRDIGGASFYTWAAMLYTIGAIVGGASTGMVWALRLIVSHRSSSRGKGGKKMAAIWCDPLHPIRYERTLTWFEAIAPSRDFRMRPTGFPARNWHPDMLSLVALAEFAATDWRDRLDPGPPPGEDETNREIDHLIDLAQQQRTERVDEILAQYVDHHKYYLGLLMVRPETHPATYLLLKIAARVTEFTLAYFKNKYNRARPYQYYPALMPPLDTAVHPSYPNGHALHGAMKAHSVADAVPQMEEPMLRLAKRIWQNAEIGGFHFPSDAVASHKIAEGAMQLLRGVLNHQGCPSYKKAVEAAKLEWQGALGIVSVI